MSLATGAQQRHAIKAVTLELIRRDTPSFFRRIEQSLARGQREPRQRLGQLEQIKARTDHFNPIGELNGGNFGSGF